MGFLVGRGRRRATEPPAPDPVEESGPSPEEEAEALDEWRGRVAHLPPGELRAAWPELVTEVAWLYAGGAFAELRWGEPLVESGLDPEAISAIAAALGRILDRPLAINPAEAESLDLDALLREVA